MTRINLAPPEDRLKKKLNAARARGLYGVYALPPWSHGAEWSWHMRVPQTRQGCKAVIPARVASLPRELRARWWGIL